MKFKFLLGVFLLLTFSLVFTFGTASANNSEETENTIVIFEKTEKEIEKELKMQAEREIQAVIGAQSEGGNGEIRPMNDPSEYKYEWGTRVTRSVTGWAGNQVSGGVRFTTGGGFYWSDGGGSSATLNIDFPKPYSYFSLSIPLGVRSASVTGYFVSVPNKTDYFKLAVTKYYEVQPYVVYQKTYDYNSGMYYWKKAWTGHTKSHTRTSLSALKASVQL